MLKEISIRNFKSINEEQLFTMEAAPKSEISEYYDSHVVDIFGEKLLKISSIYGPNGGGKSNLIQAIFLLRSLVLGVRRFPHSYINYGSSIFNESNEIKLTSFFVKDSIVYGYSVSFRFRSWFCHFLVVSFG